MRNPRFNSAQCRFAARIGSLGLQDQTMRESPKVEAYVQRSCAH
ncbi:uncharacterized protein G2W53_043114 [Senna tora]|uniref:Uncharacterized protein n=1 Tax=Senna tora TaxID=362788 RepID=A0A834VZK3_9FABA|nr:uncharacterized protein G2W53_043114 [Senna tora]